MTDVAALEQQVRELIQAGKFEEAEALVRPLLVSGTGPIVLWRLLAAAIRPQGRIAETRQIQEMIVEAVPGHLPGRFDLAETALLMGDFERGWREYHWRYSLPHTLKIERKVQRPRWDGRRIPGKTFLLHDEQGYGDTLQFMRMVPWAKEASGARLVLEVVPDLLPLVKRTTGFDELLPRGTIPPAFDVHCEMMSLPMIMGLKPTDLPGKTPYLTPDAARVAKWRKRLAKLRRPLVALVWAGRPEHHNDANRSMTLGDLAPLALPGVTFLAVQKGPRAVDAKAPPAGMSILSLDDEIRDFEDTAAILMVADVLISVDSSPVHLAGAMGRPAWVLLPFVPDWRWLLGRDDTPWYPSVRLFRQETRKDWRAPVTRAAEALAALMAKGK
ncbi:MAG TPA: hypothetical protein VL574_05305 [Stellaceae bacterium]|nr:hypothetical protein [Stellaceae bacterium]